MTMPMPAAVRPRPVNGRPAAAPTQLAKPKNRLALIDPATVPPDRIIINGVEGWGKTSLVSFAPDAAILMAKGETGYETLLKAQLVPSCPAVELATWSDVLDQLEYLATEAVPYQTLALDALGGFERLCHEHVCERDFDGVWGDKGFQAYMRGYDVSIAEWLKMLVLLDRIRAKGIAIVLLSHAKAKTFKNPLGPDFDRYSADCHDKTWAATAKWADNIFFATFNTIVVDAKGALAKDSAKGRKKGIGGDERVIFTQRRDAYDAKNRHGMALEVPMPNVPGDMWATLMEAMVSATEEAPPPVDDAPPV